MRLEEDTKEARLMIDFSSLADHEAALLQAPTGYSRDENGEQISLGVANPFPGIYSMSIRDGKRGQVIRMDFKIAWENLLERAESRPP